MINKIKAKALITVLNAQMKIIEMSKNTKGDAYLTAIVLAIIVLVVLFSVVYFPTISAWFSDVMTNLSTETDTMFNFTLSQP